MADIKPEKVGDCYKLVLRSMQGTTMPDNSYRFNVDLKDIEGERVRCALKKVRHPPPATYITRRLWLADGNTWKNSFTDPQGKVNDYNALLSKYGLNVWIYLYYPTRNIYLRILWNNTENASIRQTLFSSSLDGINWSGSTTATNIGLIINVDWSGGALIPFDCYEIDITTTPAGLRMQNIHCPQLKASYSYDSTTRTTTDIIGHIGNNQNFNPYVMNDATYNAHDTDCANEISGDVLRGTSTLDISFSRVNTPTVKENVPNVMPFLWFIELVFYNVD